MRAKLDSLDYLMLGVLVVSALMALGDIAWLVSGGPKELAGAFTLNVLSSLLAYVAYYFRLS